MNIFEILREKVGDIENALETLENTKIIVDEVNIYVEQEKRISNEQGKITAYNRVYLKGCELLQKNTEPAKALNELINFVTEEREKQNERKPI